jgi:hypothetical protein
MLFCFLRALRHFFESGFDVDPIFERSLIVFARRGNCIEGGGMIFEWSAKKGTEKHKVIEAAN